MVTDQEGTYTPGAARKPNFTDWQGGDMVMPNWGILGVSWPFAPKSKYDSKRPPPKLGEFQLQRGAQWAKTKAHSTKINKIYENGQIYEQNID